MFHVVVDAKDHCMYSNNPCLKEWVVGQWVPTPKTKGDMAMYGP